MNKNIIALEFKKIKEKYNLTNESWSKKCGVPVGTIGRYLSAKSVNLPTYLHTCAMLRCVNESADDFYDRVTAQTGVPAEVLKLGVVPTGVVDELPLEVPEAKKEIQERIILQAEEIQRLRTESNEKDMQIELLEVRLETMERVLEAVKALCSSR